eukprot:6228833-Lingulodinium_polyedra.AAC.1
MSSNACAGAPVRSVGATASTPSAVPFLRHLAAALRSSPPRAGSSSSWAACRRSSAAALAKAAPAGTEA